MSIRVKAWNFITKLYPYYLKKMYGMHIGENCVISWKAHLDKSINPQGIYIGNNTWILARAMILAHDHCRGIKADTYIGDNCVIGISSIIMPGIHIGNHVVIGGGSVVTKDIPSNCIAVGNLAKVIKENIKLKDGRIIKD